MAGDDVRSDEEAFAVRPYMVTKGRVRRDDLPMESLVRTISDVGDETVKERRGILELTATRMLSVVELSAHLKLPLGVVRVLVGDLADEGRVAVHRPASASGGPAADLTVLESVLDGIAAL
ncbi:MAG: DUF742 domain-containing protein [Actinomycetes bacterium]